MAIAVDRTNLVFGLVACAGIGQFVAATYLAMRSYPSANCGTESGYQLTGHFLSDLGSSKTTDGLTNADSALMFNRSVIGLGIALMPFFCVLASRCGRAGWLVRGCGALSALGLVGIGLTPYDQHFAAHHVALALWLAPLLVVMVAYFSAAALREEASVWLWIATSLIVLVVSGYAAAGSRDGYIVLQKEINNDMPMSI